MQATTVKDGLRVRFAEIRRDMEGISPKTSLYAKLKAESKQIGARIAAINRGELDKKHHESN